MPSADDNPLLALDPAMPVAKAAAAVLALRLGETAKLVRKARDSKLKGDKGVKLVHALRVSTRRSQAALDAFEAVVPRRDRERLSKVLRSIRKAAGDLRDPHVQIEALAGAGEAALSEAQRRALGHLAERAAKREAKARSALRAVLDAAPARQLAKAPRPAATTATLRDTARTVLSTHVKAIHAAAKGDLTDLVHVHELRVLLKKFRYALEVFIACVPPGERGETLQRLASIQESLGAVNDAFTLHRDTAAEVARLGKRGAEDKDAIQLLRGLKPAAAEQHRRLAKAHKAFCAAWKELSATGYFDRVLASLQPPKPAAPQVEIKPPSLNGHHRGNGKPAPKRRRIAAIDVGTNSVRLIVAEAGERGDADAGSYRVLDDEKEITRLGKGLHRTGRMDEASIEHTAQTIARMRSIAEGYGAKELRVVGTSAAREAKNGKELLKRIREAAGVEMEVISGDEEAMLAFRSAARAFDLSAQPALVFDIGGGSVELVLSAGAGQPGLSSTHHGALIEHVYSLPLGAVRLTERFGGPEAASADRFDELREHIKAALSKTVGRPPIWPQLVVGTGGTLTTLGLMSLHQSLGEQGVGLFGKVQGTMVTRAQVRHLLDYVRKLPVKDRTKVAGLSADRTDIIVAGLAVVDVVLKYFGSNRLKVHEGGIRDGLLLSMVEPAGSGGGGDSADARPDPLKSVRRFAKDCNYEASHAKQVTRLALRIFDQLAPRAADFDLPAGARFDAEARMLLESASLLHDVGYLINYAQHHKHSYHLIVHADLPGLTTRQVQVIANVARYHRAADPKTKHGPFARLSAEDRALVCQLSAILRVADGLDRTHMQSIRDLTLVVGGGRQSVDMTVTADAEPSVDIWGAVRKAGLFRKVFGRVVNVEWTRPPAGQPAPAAAVA